MKSMVEENEKKEVKKDSGLIRKIIIGMLIVMGLVIGAIVLSLLAYMSTFTLN